DVKRVDLLVGGDAPIGGDLLLDRRGRQRKVEVVRAGIVAQPREELDKVRIDVDAHAGRHDIADHPGLAGRQATRTRVRPVAVATRGVGDTTARFLRDLGIAVEGAAYRRLRQGQHFGELLKVQVG